VGGGWSALTWRRREPRRNGVDNAQRPTDATVYTCARNHLDSRLWTRPNRGRIRGSGWMQLREHAGKVHLGKLGAASGQSFSGMVVLTRLPTLKSKEEFFELVSGQRARDSDDPRFEELTKDEATSVEDGVWVFRFHVKYKDLGANNLPAGAGHLIVEDFGAVFRHPNEEGVAVSVSLSQRSMPQDVDETFEQLAEDFLSSVEFNSDRNR
jgi:hypothetical protein